MAAIEGIDYTIEGDRWIWTATFLAKRGFCCGSGCRNCPYCPRGSGAEASLVGPVEFPIGSFVPSWTETLMHLGLRPAGRTRYCVHPASSKDIAVLGGTKDLSAASLTDIKYAILDRQENTLTMSEALGKQGIQTWASDVRNVETLALECRRLREQLVSWGAWTDANSWSRMLQSLDMILHTKLRSLDDFTSQKIFLRWVEGREAPRKRAAGLAIAISERPVVAVIWDRPVMVVRPGTFIGDMLDRRGFRLWDARPGTPSLYPEIRPHELPQDALVLLLSEPFPFASADRAERSVRAWSLETRPDLSFAVVDGEPLSWFGIRALEALLSDLKLTER